MSNLEQPGFNIPADQNPERRRSFAGITPLSGEHRLVLYSICFGFGALSIFSSINGSGQADAVKGGTALTFAAIEFFIARGGRR